MGEGMGNATAVADNKEATMLGFKVFVKLNLHVVERQFRLELSAFQEVVSNYFLVIYR